MRMVSVRGETLLAAADAKLLNTELREKNLHLSVKEEFYGNVKVSEDTFVASLRLCTIANLVGDLVVGIAIKEGFVDKNNVIKIDGIPHAQYAKMFI